MNVELLLQEKHRSTSLFLIDSLQMKGNSNKKSGSVNINQLTAFFERLDSS